MRYRIYSAIVLFTMVLSPLLSTLAPAQAQEIQSGDWSWISVDLDSDGLPDEIETGGWCNAVGCFQTDPADPDSDNDSLTDGEEKLFESNPTSSASPGI